MACVGQQGVHAVSRRVDQQAVGKKAQGPLRCNARVQLAHRTCSGVARIDKGFFTLHAGSDAAALALVQRFKVIAAHVDLATHLQRVGRIVGQAQRNLPDGAYVGCDVLAGLAIAPRGGPHQHAVFVAQAERQTVKFKFGHIRDRRRVGIELELAADACIEVFSAAGLGIGFGADAEHRRFVAHAAKGVQHLSAHALCW